MRLILLRHGKTAGNLDGRYIGRTDEPLCPDGIQALKLKSYPQAAAVYCSPLLRCRETAALLYPGHPVEAVADFRECDFGIFEGKNYEELKENRAYQRWLDSGGRLAFPHGEGREAFSNRVAKAFDRLASVWRGNEPPSAALVVHGGTIMAILERFAVPHRDFYAWQVKNGEAYTAELCWTEEGRAVLKRVERWEDMQK